MILCYAQTFNMLMSEHTAVDCNFLELVPTLYKQVENQVTLHALCDPAPPGQKRSRSGTPPIVHCAGPAVIRIKVVIFFHRSIEITLIILFLINNLINKLFLSYDAQICLSVEFEDIHYSTKCSRINYHDFRLIPIEKQVSEARVSDGVDQMISQNRAEYENLLVKASQAPPSKVTQGCVFAEHLIA